MQEKYIIINREEIEKRIEELQIVEKQQTGTLNEYIARGGRRNLQQILSNSIPLEKEIEKTFDVSNNYTDKSFDDFKKEYISNLKLDI